jgi:hypothetical protein
VKDSNLKVEMLKYAPSLAVDYEIFVRRRFADMVSDLGSILEGVYGSRKWSSTFYGISSNLTQGNVSSISYREKEKWPYYIDEKALKVNAKKYGENTALAWYDKMQGKLGDLDNVTVTPPDNSGYVTITGNYKDNSVRIEQQRIINQSSRGLLFHQFPSRIYVNGKTQSEVEYKKTLRKWNVPHLEKTKFVTKYKCSHCGYTDSRNAFRHSGGMGEIILRGLYCPKCRGLNIRRIDDSNKKPKIDPLTRPLQFKYEFKKLRPDGTVETDRNYPIKASNSKEAIEKITRDEMRYGYFTKIYDFKLLQVRTWNDMKIWKIETDLDKPVPVSSFKSKSQLKKGS